jgi:DNA-binding response OmpR family regulator
VAGRIFVVEDDPAIARSLRRLLAHEQYYVAEAATAEIAAERLAADPAYDLILMDVALPGIDGYACCQQLRASGCRRPIIMLTGRANSVDKVRGLECGADDYITKPFEPFELLARIKAQIRRAREYSRAEPQSHRLFIGPDLVIDSRLRDALVRGKPVHLTAREFELLDLLARSANVPLRKAWIYQQVWGCASEMGMKLLAVTVRRIRIKIEDEPEQPRFLLAVRGFGYQLVSPVSDGSEEAAPA